MLSGTIDFESMADSMTKDEIYDWLAFGLLEGWMPVVSQPSSKMTPEQFKAQLERRHAQ